MNKFILIECECCKMGTIQRVLDYKIIDKTLEYVVCKCEWCATTNKFQKQ